MATEEYFDSEDMTALWITECCDTGRHCEGLSGALFKSWTAWALQAGEKAGSNKGFTRVLEKHGFPAGRHGMGGRMIDGIRLRVDAARTEPGKDREWP
jgi:phage/plasmid-associated DNA primase